MAEPEPGTQEIKTEHDSPPSSQHFCIHPSGLSLPAGSVGNSSSHVSGASHTARGVVSIKSTEAAAAAALFKFADVSDAVKMSVDVDNVFIPVSQQQQQHQVQAKLENEPRHHCEPPMSLNCDVEHVLPHYGSECIHGLHLEHFLTTKTEVGMDVAGSSSGSNSPHAHPLSMHHASAASSSWSKAPAYVYPRVKRTPCCQPEVLDGRLLRKRSTEQPQRRLSSSLGVATAVGNNLDQLVHAHHKSKLYGFDALADFSGQNKRHKLEDELGLVAMSTPDVSLPPMGSAGEMSSSLEMTGGPHLCRFCLKAFPTNADCAAHEEFHTGTKPFLCDLCGKTFKHEAHLAQHSHTHAGVHGTEGTSQRDGSDVVESCVLSALSIPPETVGPATRGKSVRKKGSKKPYKCQQCGKSFMQEVNLAQHVKTHSCHKPYRCEYCGKSFAKTICLKQHINTHTGEKPFKCRFCSAAFSHSGSLYHHEKGQHKPDGAKLKPN